MTLLLASMLLGAQVASAPAEPPPTASDAVEIVLFSDFQCPFCAMFARSYRELEAKEPDGVKARVRFRHFPLVIHPKAELAHQAALAAGEQGKFWEMHDLLFARPDRVEREDLLGHAKALGLNVERFTRDMDSERLKAIVDADKAEGEKLGVSGTPTFYVNGKQHVGTKSVAELKDLLFGEQRRARALAEITDDLMSRGPAGAPVTLELFADLQSPVSRPAVNVLNDLMKRYPERVRLQFRNFPLAFHPMAALAHEAAMTAAREGRFWEFASYVLDHQGSLREQDLIALAGRLGLDQEAFAATIQQHRYAARVEADVEAAFRRGIRGSPSILVNGQRIDGVPSLQTLTELVEAALSAPEANHSSR